MLDDFADDVLHDLVVGVQQIVAAHAWLARDPSGDNDDVGIGRCGVVVGSEYVRVTLFDWHCLKQVETLALRNTFDDVNQNDVSQFF